MASGNNQGPVPRTPAELQMSLPLGDRIKTCTRQLRDRTGLFRQQIICFFVSLLADFHKFRRNGQRWHVGQGKIDFSDNSDHDTSGLESGRYD